MRKRLLVGRVPLLLSLVTLAGSVAVGSQDRGDDERTRQQFIGAWRLVWLEEPSSDGNVHKADCTGMLVFTREGGMSVQVMYREPRVEAAAGPVQYAQGGYEASFGRYAVDAGARTFSYHVEGALVHSLIGKELTRRFELSGNLLVVRSSDPKELWRVAWEHHQAGDQR
jgi:hypothetical protein